MTLPYFITWTSQKEATTLPLDKVGPYSFHHKNKTWIDLSSISFQASFGLDNQSIKKAMLQQMEKFSLASPKHTFKLKEKVSLDLLERVNFQKKHLTKVFYTQSGSEGIENALKMARQYTQKKIILSRKISYHGATMGALSITGDWRHKDHLLPKEWTSYIPEPDDDPEGIQLEKLILKLGPENIAAFCLETITGGNGVFIPPKKWYKKVQELSLQYNILIILDEVVCGAHRTGPFAGFHHYKGLRPDIVVMAKGLTGGYFPLGAVLVHKKIDQFYNKHTLSCGLTNYAHPIGLAALSAVLTLTQKKSFHNNLNKNIKTLKDFKKELEQDPFVEKVRHIGLLMAIEFKKPVSVNEIFSAGFYFPIQNQRAILAPALTMPNKELAEHLKKVRKLLGALHE